MVGTAVTYSLLFISLYFEVFLLVSFLERGFLSGNKKSTAEPSRYPSVAIVVPCYNEEKSLQSTMSSLLALEYPKDKFEILVVDDGSSDNTLAIAKTFESDSRVHVFHKENGGKHTAMNLGLANTSAELIGCLDADSVVAPDGLLKVVAIFENEKVAAVTPGIHVKEADKNLLQHMQKVEYRLSVFNRFMLAALGSAFITPGPFSIFRASVVRELGGWKYGYSTEDMEMALRMQNAGYLIANAPRAIVHTGTPRTIRQLFHQRVRWTYGWLRNAVDYRHMIGNKKYGNLGIIVLPCALISIGAAIFFFFKILFEFVQLIRQEVLKIEVTGTLPHFVFNLFYFNTSTMWILVWLAVGMILILVALGSFIGTGKKSLPIGTPLFVLFYSFLVPLWLGTAVVRAVFKTGVRWR